MSWWGVHPEKSRAEISRLVPYQACAHCRYYLRLSLPKVQRFAATTDPLPGRHPDFACPRCGLDLSQTILDLIQQLRTADSRPPSPPPT